MAANPEKWVEEHGNYLYRFALGRLRNPHLAENLVQETFLAGVKAQKTFSGRSSERTWLIGILKHKIIDYYRKKYRETPITDLKQDNESIDKFYDRSGHPKNTPAPFDASPRELLRKSEFWDVLEKCLKKLPPRIASAFSMRELDDMDSKEICKIMNVKPTNLWVMMHRARLQIRACLEKNWFSEDH